VDDLLAFNHLAEHGVLAVQPRARHVGNKELAAIGAGTGIGHRQHAALVRQAIAGLVLETVARAAGTGALGAAALDHEVVQHAVEIQAVVEAALGEVDEVGNRQRRLVGSQFNADRAALGIKGSDQAHEELRLSRGGVCMNARPPSLPHPTWNPARYPQPYILADFLMKAAYAPLYPMSIERLRNIAIVAHVDHGKTTIVDCLLKQSG